MYLIRRVAKCQTGKAWEVAGHLSKIVQAYEGGGRDKARVYIGGQGLPGTPQAVYAEWTQETIEPTVMSTVPQAVRDNNGPMQALLTEYTIEFYELVTPEKLQQRGFA